MNKKRTEKPKRKTYSLQRCSALTIISLSLSIVITYINMYRFFARPISWLIEIKCITCCSCTHSYFKWHTYNFVRAPDICVRTISLDFFFFLLFLLVIIINVFLNSDETIIGKHWWKLNWFSFYFRLKFKGDLFGRIFVWSFMDSGSPWWSSDLCIFTMLWLLYYVRCVDDSNSWTGNGENLHFDIVSVGPC